MQNARQHLEDQGYCVIEQVIDAAAMEDARAISARALAEVSADHRARNRSQGSLINMVDYPDYARIIGDPGIRRVLSDLGFADPRFSSGYLISKPPGGPPLFWHQDWWGWDDEISYGPTIAQAFFMIYLTDTTVENGCLRAIPGSHRQPHPLHEALEAHGEELSRVENPDDPLFGAMQDEVPVPVRAGDLVVGDARLLHAAHANTSTEERSLLTLWYHPDFANLPAGMRARIRQTYDREGVDTDPTAGHATTPDDWPSEFRSPVEDLLVPGGQDAPPHSWNRVPNWP
ncbi:MAG: phytanoyl-CoA dioxygenase family protein [Pseudomonadota bacterium]